MITETIWEEITSVATANLATHLQKALEGLDPASLGNEQGHLLEALRLTILCPMAGAKVLDDLAKDEMIDGDWRGDSFV